MKAWGELKKYVHLAHALFIDQSIIVSSLFWDVLKMQSNSNFKIIFGKQWLEMVRKMEQQKNMYILDNWYA